MSPSLAKCVEDTLYQLSDSYVKTLEVGRRFCESAIEPESQNDLHLELQAVQDDWERSTLLLQQRRDLEHTAITVKATHNRSQLLFCLFVLSTLEKKIEVSNDR